VSRASPQIRSASWRARFRWSSAVRWASVSTWSAWCWAAASDAISGGIDAGGGASPAVGPPSRPLTRPFMPASDTTTTAPPGTVRVAAGYQAGDAPRDSCRRRRFRRAPRLRPRASAGLPGGVLALQQGAPAGALAVAGLPGCLQRGGGGDGDQQAGVVGGPFHVDHAG